MITFSIVVGSVFALLVVFMIVAFREDRRDLFELSRAGLRDDYPVRNPDAIRAERERCHRCRIGKPPWMCTCEHDCYEADCQGGYVTRGTR